MEIQFISFGYRLTKNNPTNVMVAANTFLGMRSLSFSAKIPSRAIKITLLERIGKTRETGASRSAVIVKRSASAFVAARRGTRHLCSFNSDLIIFNGINGNPTATTWNSHSIVTYVSADENCGETRLSIVPAILSALVIKNIATTLLLNTKSDFFGLITISSPANIQPYPIHFSNEIDSPSQAIASM